MSVRIKDTGLTEQDEIRLSQAMEAATGRPSGPWLTPDQYMGGGGDMTRNQAMFATHNQRKAVSQMAKDRDQLLAAIAERDILLGKAADAIEALEQQNGKLKAESEKLRGKK